MTTNMLDMKFRDLQLLVDQGKAVTIWNKSKGPRRVAIVLLKGDRDNYFVTWPDMESIMHVGSDRDAALSSGKSHFGDLPLPTVAWLKGNFVWGVVEQVHEIGTYQIVEYVPNQASNVSDEEHAMRLAKHPTSFHPYVGGVDQGASYHSLDRALLGCIVKTHTKGVQAHVAVDLASRMLGVED